MILREYQKATIDYILDFFRKKSNGKILISSPTGTGKGVIQNTLLKIINSAAPDAIVHLITTRLAIVRNYLNLLGYDADNMSESKMRKTATKHGIFTYTSYRNRLIKQDIQAPNVLIIDECHRFKLGNVVADHIFYFCEQAKVVGMTASPFRSTALKTKEFQAQWDEIYTAISIIDAYNQGYWKLPDIEIKGLIDDDEIRVSGGKFVISAIESEFDKQGESLLAQISNLAREYWVKTKYGSGVISVPSVALGKALLEYMEKDNIPTTMIDHKTKFDERQLAIRKLSKGQAILIQVAIVSEGFDLPQLAFFIDAKPKMSPVNFIQEFGRITRPHEGEKFYICLNRNIERHAYLLEGLLPSATIRDAQQAFPNPSLRSGRRVFGLERMGVFKPILFTRLDGLVGSFYSISHYDKPNRKTKLVSVVLLPDRVEPLVAEKYITRTAEIDPITRQPKYEYSPWQEIPMPNDQFKGFETDKRKHKMSESQKRSWKYAWQLGLDPSVTPNAREYQIKHILKDCKVKL